MNKLFIIAIFAAVLVVSFVLANFLLASSNVIELKLVQLNSGPFYLFNTSYFGVKINNTGNSYIKGMLLGIYINNNSYKAFNVTLPPHEGATIPFNYTFMYAGNFYVEAVADPARIMNLTGNTSSSLYVNASMPASNPYTIKTSNITSIYNFTMIRNIFPIFAESANITSFQNASGIGRIFSIDGGILQNVAKALYGTINVLYGISADYGNGAICNELSISGIAKPTYINSIISNFTVNASSENGIEVFSYKNSTICTFYSKGYTHIVLYKGKSGSCVSSIGNSTLNSANPAIINFAKKIGNENVSSLGSEFYSSKN
ncbi:MAG: hypothetical protein QXS03_03085, partial [Candidatus Micrarchaeaceae archaeon]